MAQEPWNPPPRFSTPREAPWTEVEAVIDGLRVVSKQLADLITIASGGVVQPGTGIPGEPGALGTIILPELPSALPGGLSGLKPAIPGLAGLPQLIAALVSINASFNNVLTVPSTILARLNSLYEDYGTAQGGTTTTLSDTTKIWGINCWAGHTLFIFKQGVLYVKPISSNTNQILVFPALPTGVTPDEKTIYWVQPPVNTPGATFLTGQRTVAAAGTPVQLSTTSIPVRAGTRVTVISKPGNTGAIYFAASQALCVAGTYFDGLNPGLAASIAVTDVNQIWIDAANNNDGASYYVEQ